MLEAETRQQLRELGGDAVRRVARRLDVDPGPAGVRQEHSIPVDAPLHRLPYRKVVADRLDGFGPEGDPPLNSGLDSRIVQPRGVEVQVRQLHAHSPFAPSLR